MRSLGTAVVFAAIIALCACGGGKGSGPASLPPLDGGPPGSKLTLTEGALTFVQVLGLGRPSAQRVWASWEADGAVAFGAAVQGGAKPSWLSFPAQGTVSGKYGSLSVSVDPTGLPAGTRSATLQIGIARADGSIISAVDLTVTLIVKAFGAAEAAVSSDAVYGSSATPIPRSVWVGDLQRSSWTATTNAAWLRLDPASGPAGYMAVRFDATGLGTGDHHGTITFTSAGGAVDTLPVTLTVATPSLTVSPSPLPLAGLGGYATAPQAVEVSLDTGTNAYPFTVATDTPWIVLAEGVSAASAAAGSFTATPSLAAREWAAGTSTTGRITVTADVNGLRVTRSLDVSYVPADLRLLVSDDGIALTRTPGLERLSRVVEVRTNRGLPASWTATSSAAWLAVTSSGVTGSPLVLHVPDPSGLAPGLHEATVTVSSPDPRLVHATETIRVGLWLGDVTPELVTTVTDGFAPSGPGGFAHVAADPVRPYAYITEGTSTVRVYHVHTGALLGVVTVPGAELGSLTTSSDGQRLWVLDGKLPERRIVPVDLVTRAVGTPWLLPPSASNGSGIAFARTNGVPLVVTTFGTIYDAETATAVATFVTPSEWSRIAVSQDGSRFCVLRQGVSPGLLECHDLAVASGAAREVRVGPGKATGAGDGDVALSPDGARVYVAPGGTSRIMSWDATFPQTLPPLAPLGTWTAPTAIAVGRDGRVYCGADPIAYGPTSAFVYDASGTLLASYALSRFIPGAIAVSGDGLRLVAGIDAYPARSLKLVTLPPP